MHYLFQRSGGPLLKWKHGPPRGAHAPVELSGYIPVMRRGGAPEPLAGIGSVVGGGIFTTVLGGLFLAGLSYGAGKALANRLISK